ncbi:MAG: argininosuccinate lyase [Planctomycetota bacterium]
MSGQTHALWGGRFAGELDPHFAAFQCSLPFDRRLLDAELRASQAWADALAKAGVLTPTQAKKITTGLRRLGQDVARDPKIVTRSDAEDIHGFVEAALQQRIGGLARRLHTGRSRNDQVATDLKLYLLERLQQLDHDVTALMLALVKLANAHADLAMPGYTHLQRAQPIAVGHHALAYVEMLARDRERLVGTLERASTCPLGSGALAGTAFRIDRRQLARTLGFRAATRNSLDAVSDRDHACEAAFACSLLMVHLSRLAEDWIFCASHEAGFLQLDDAVSTGSSLMPQKKNPDALELVRGKTGRVIGDLQTLLVALKGLPLAYNKDLQEDKEALFDALDTAAACVAVTTTVVRSARFDAARCRAAAAEGYLNATDLADLLVAAGVPFRDAHERVGVAVRRALALGIELEALPDADRRELLPELGDNLARALAPDQVLARRTALGGTAPARVRAEAKAWHKRLQS